MDFDAVTPQEITAARDSTRTPDRPMLARLLETYFVGPIDPAVVARLESDLGRLLSDPNKWASQAHAFTGNRRSHFGEAWREVLSNHDLPPAPTELAAWIAVTDSSYPRPRPYCPKSLVGAWTQTLPARASWRMDAEGSLQTDDAIFAGFTSWHVHRINDRASLTGADLWLHERGGSRLCSIRDVTPTTARWRTVGRDGVVDHLWERA